jgi:hypothetical protein
MTTAESRAEPWSVQHFKPCSPTSGRGLVVGELGRWSFWAAHRRIRGWLGHPTWRAAIFRTAAELRGLARAARLDVVEIRGAVHYPPHGIAARVLAPIDLWLGQRTTFGATFIAELATKPTTTPNSEGN